MRNIVIYKKTYNTNQDNESHCLTDQQMKIRLSQITIITNFTMVVVVYCANEYDE